MDIPRIRAKTKDLGVGIHLQRLNHLVKDGFSGFSFYLHRYTGVTSTGPKFQKQIYIDIQNYYKVFIKSLVKYRSQNVVSSVSRLRVASLCLLVSGVASSVVVVLSC